MGVVSLSSSAGLSEELESNRRRCRPAGRRRVPPLDDPVQARQGNLGSGLGTEGAGVRRGARSLPAAC